jgi:hypothetical protein
VFGFVILRTSSGQRVRSVPGAQIRREVIPRMTSPSVTSMACLKLSTTAAFPREQARIVALPMRTSLTINFCENHYLTEAFRHLQAHEVRRSLAVGYMGLYLQDSHELAAHALDTYRYAKQHRATEAR